ncbi:siderophore ABC transporter substrate-binding protein [uncultured Clostridium sp.]|uniref:siderophore ABC transporter substrate-binding protein n=1 Tax=uncultured Clostridium sp. TaxID=59620 RepID=UPI0025FB2D4D|nr:siderophore ABC transporter substrate-binding protein [uncultured Clostridium sp.]
MKKRRLLSVLLSTVVAAGILGGCGKTEDSSAVNGEMITVTDRNGEVEVPKNPEKVVVLDYGSLDILDEIGVESVVGVPKNGIPEYLDKYEDEKYTDIGGVKEFNFETINELDPDLIIIEGRQEDSLEELQKIAPTVYLGSVGSDYLNSIKSNAKVLGEIFDKEKEVEEKLANIDTRVNEIKAKVVDSNLNALATMISDGSMSVYGAGSRFNIIYNELGFVPTDESIEVSNHGQSISYEYLAEKNPDYLFVIDKGAVTGSGTPAKDTVENELVKTTDTYKNGNIVYVDSVAWYVGGAGFKALDKMLDDVENAL